LQPERRVLIVALAGPRYGFKTQVTRILGAFMDLLWTIAVILIILWLVGMVSSYTLGGFVHILLVLAIIVVLIRVIQGRRAV
jgi:asparagine N-glycosylation enzyme membrane subunit Stt3